MDAGTSQRDPIILLRIERGNGAGLTATNLGLPGYQVGVGFTEGDDALWAHGFANRVLDRLKSKWHIEYVPAKEGAFPLRGCSQ